MTIEFGKVHNLSALRLLGLLGDNSIDSAPMDPPYGLNFMGKAWDKVLPEPTTWHELLRVMKPGAHGAVFSGTRTEHRLGVHLEDAGFEIRDKIMWLYGSGFPKSHNINGLLGTALKPAWEPIYLVRKPIEGTVEHNFNKWGTGCLNIESARIGNGRWPANIILDEVSAQMLDMQSGYQKDGVATNRNRDGVTSQLAYSPRTILKEDKGFGGGGGASRFFYCAKASPREREEGLDGYIERLVGSHKLNTHPTVKPIELMRYIVKLITPEGGNVLDLFAGSGTTGIAAALEGRPFMGCDLEQRYADLANARISHWTQLKC